MLPLPGSGVRPAGGVGVVVAPSGSCRTVVRSVPVRARIACSVAAASGSGVDASGPKPPSLPCRVASQALAVACRAPWPVARNAWAALAVLTVSPGAPRYGTKEPSACWLAASWSAAFLAVVSYPGAVRRARTVTAVLSGSDSQVPLGHDHRPGDSTVGALEGREAGEGRRGRRGTGTLQGDDTQRLDPGRGRAEEVPGGSAVPVLPGRRADVVGQRGDQVTAAEGAGIATGALGDERQQRGGPRIGLAGRAVGQEEAVGVGGEEADHLAQRRILGAAWRRARWR